MSTVPILGQTPFAVIDLEATGIYAGNRDRIIEVAVVRTTPGLEIDDEWTTLVNPRRDIGRTDIHGIQAGDVAHAPTFDEVAGDVGERLRGAVIVAHNLSFDLRFLAAEYGRCGVTMPDPPGLCTLRLAFLLLPDAPSRKLVYCCEQVGILHEEEHTALGDAKATAYLLARLVEMTRERGVTTLRDLGCRPLLFPAASGSIDVKPSGRRLSRHEGAERRREARAYLARLIQRMPGDEARNPREAEYLALLDRVLEDRRVTSEEAVELARTAASWGMTRPDVLESHRAYLASLASEALADGHVDGTEHRDDRHPVPRPGVRRPRPGHPAARRRPPGWRRRDRDRAPA